MIYIVIPVFNRWHFTYECLKSLSYQTYKDFKVVVVDHGSTDGTSKKLADCFPEVVVLGGDESMWWTAATNVGIKYALNNVTDFILTLNNDLVVEPDYLEYLVKASEGNSKSIIGSIALDKERQLKIVFAGVKWSPLTAKYRPAVSLSQTYTKLKQQQDVIYTDLLPGRGTLIPCSVFSKIGLFDEVDFPHYAADEDFSLKARYAGYELKIAVDALVYSEVNATGLKSSYHKKNYSFWKDTFFSQRSPTKLSVRWKWARKHGRIPLIYFFIDVSRIIFSKLKK